MHSSLLRYALGANALFSAACGIACLFFTTSIASVMGDVDLWFLRLLGAALLLFAVFLLWLIRRPSPHPIASLFVTLADLGWVVSSLVLLVLGPDAISAEGQFLIAGVAAMVLLFALLQMAGLRAQTANRSGRTAARSAFDIRRSVSAPAEAIWERVRDLEAIGRFYPVLREVEVDGASAGEGLEGARRTCENHQGQRWTEEVLAWDDHGRSMTLAFDTAAPKFPFPVTEMYGGWRVEAAGGHTEVVVWFEFTVRGGVFGEILAPVIAHQSTPGLEAAIANMDAEATRSAGVGATR